MTNYIKWVGHQLKTQGHAGWMIWLFGLGFQLGLFLKGQITADTTVALVATIVGLLCTTTMMSGKPVNGLLGLISAAGFIYINWNAGHYASVLDQLVFVALIDLPLILTYNKWGDKVKDGVKKLTPKGWLITIVAMLIAWIPVTMLYGHLHDTQPLIDSAVLIIGATASIYVFRGYGDSYSLWMASNIINIVLWVVALKNGFSPASLAMLVSMIMYMFTAVYGRTDFWK